MTTPILSAILEKDGSISLTDLAEGADPLEIARPRYARGEISREEFEQLRENLTHSSRTP